jgi:serine/threonine protein kinase
MFPPSQVVSLLNAYHMPPSYYIFMPFHPLPIESLINSSSFATSPNFETLVKSLSYQALSALDYLHSHQPAVVAHRDVKPANFLIDIDGRLVLIDFGTAWKEGGDEKPGEMQYELGTGSVMFSFLFTMSLC